MRMYRYIDIPDPMVSPPIEHLIAHQEALLSRILVPTDSPARLCLRTFAVRPRSCRLLLYMPMSTPEPTW